LIISSHTCHERRYVALLRFSSRADGGRITSNGGVMFWRRRSASIVVKLAAVICDPRDPQRVVRRLPDILRARIFAIACGYEDADDLDWLRSDPACLRTVAR
jgi:hypothetical protein